MQQVVIPQESNSERITVDVPVPQVIVESEYVGPPPAVASEGADGQKCGVRACCGLCGPCYSD